LAVSTDFAPPFKLIAPYFIIGVASFVFSVCLLYGIDIANLSHTDATMLSWVHIFLLSFVMMVIFGAMAQLVPVVLEVGHFAVDLYYVIYPLLFVGSLMMGYGFLYEPKVLPYGGVLALVSLMIFVAETFLTINKVKKLNTVMSTVLIANISLFFGLIFGILMALGYAGEISVDIATLLRGHIYLVLFGYVGITIMGMSLVLLPMFWLSHSFSWKPVQIALSIVTVSVLSVVFSSIYEIKTLEYIGYVLAIVGMLFYAYQIFIIYKTRVRIENDIYLHSLIVSYVSFALSLILGVFYLVTWNATLLLVIGWLLFIGYITFIIIGHLYKIVPFLVWYERFSPLVGKKKVPMLADMVPDKSAKIQVILSTLGLIIGAIGIMMAQNSIFKLGVTVLLFGAIFSFKDLMYMIRYK
jgi:hypothetical protein